MSSNNQLVVALIETIRRREGEETINSNDLRCESVKIEKARKEAI